MAVTTTNLGVITAYGDAVAAGYTGTKAEWQTLMASYATVGQQAVDAKNAAVDAKNAAVQAKDTAVAAKDTATSKATEATTAANTATTKASEAAASAQNIAQSASQIAQNASDINELKEDFATMESDGVVPSAEQILTDKGVTDSVPYHYRKTGGDGADRLYDQIVGGTVCFNQLFNSSNFSQSTTISGITFTNNGDGTVTANGTATARAIFQLGIITVISGHVYIYGTPDTNNAERWIGNSTYGVQNGRKYMGKETNSGPVGMNCMVASGTTLNNYVFKPQYFDLTAMFGTTIADYIYNLEQTTAGAGVAFFKSLFPNDYYEYNSGELVSVSGVSAHAMRDADDNIIRSYPLDSTLTLRGITKLVDGKMCFDGDIYDADGTVTRRYGVVDLRTLTWQTTVENVFYANATSLGYKFYESIQAVCSKYVFGGVIQRSADASTDKAVYLNGITGIPWVFIRDSSYSDVAAFTTAMSGVMLVYELATPTTEEADPYQHLQQCDPNGTEEYVSTGIVPIGHNSFYPENLRAKVEQLPWNFASLIAPTESTYTATRNYTTGSLFIVDNVLYKATSNIANGGTITPNTNCTATTLAEIISALA